MAVVPLTRFKALAREGKAAPTDTLLRKDFVTTVEDIDDRKVRFTISTAAVDRDGDTIAVDGWQLDQFKANPVVLWAHQADRLPIGRVVEIGSDGAALKALVEFVPPDMPIAGPFADAVLRMCRTGFLNATSVGFKPDEYEIAKERMDDDAWFAPLDFTQQTLMELSVVTIPANSEALIDPAERRGPPLIVPPQELSAEEQTIKAAADAEAERIAAVTAARAMRQRRARLIAIA